LNERLTDEQYWDKAWEGLDVEEEPNRFKRFLFEPPSTRILWKQVLPRFLPRGGGRRIIELGSAPGRSLLLWKAHFDYEVFGADFSEAGLAVQRKLFARLGLDESRSIFGDFLAPDFRRTHAEAYDVVYSGGLIEHFSEPREAIEAHLEILKPGGFLVIIIPNVVGIYRRMGAPEVLAAHNLEIMRMPKFRALLEMPGLDRLYCAYYGGLNLGIALPYGDATGFLRALPKLQIVANLVSRVVPIPENRWTSPYLLYVGRKES
jgi:SAM-dependent methyltransferase